MKKATIRMIGLLLIFCAVFPGISQTKMKVYGDVYDIDRQVANGYSGIKLKTGFSFYELTDEIVSTNTSELSKIKALNEALRLPDSLALKTLREVCHQSFDLSDNLKCLESGINKLRKREMWIKERLAKDVALASCMKMESYADEVLCLENMIAKLDLDKENGQGLSCGRGETPLLKAFCYRKLL